MALCSPCHELETGDAQVIDVETQAVMEEGYSVKKGQQPEPEHCTNPEKDAREATKDAAQHETPAGADGSGLPGSEPAYKSDAQQVPGTDEAPESHASRFHLDLEHWVTEVSEVFHYRIFFIDPLPTMCSANFCNLCEAMCLTRALAFGASASEELIGQMMFTVFGPLSVPFLILLYGGKVGLENRSFWPFSRAAIPQMIIWSCLFMAIVANLFSPPNVMLIEKKFAIFCLFMRNLPIATKYAYTSSQTWESFNRKEIDEKYRAYQNMLVGWYMIPEENFALQAEVAFVGVIGSSAQRSEVAVRFLPWPRNEIDLLAMRKRVDVSSKTMFFAPTGEILRPRSCRRKAARRRIMGRDETLPECQMQSLYDGMSKFKSSSARSLNKIRSSVHGQESPQEKDDFAQYAQEEEEKILFKTAAAGGEVPIEDLFLYFLRAVQRSERAMCPPIVKMNLLLTVPTLLIPSILRLVNTGHFLGPDPVAVIAVVGLWPSNFVCLLSSLCFIGVGALDMWRRRALMRSCAAMLSVQREFRRHCPAEVDMLPVLDFSDVKTIAGWRKLRQLCHEWGKFYHLRIRAFSAEFFAFLLLILADLIAGMLISEYTELSGVNLSSLLVAGNVSTALMVCILLLVYLGNEVNAAAERHRFILNRQRSLLVAMKHDDKSRKSTSLACSKLELEQATDLMASLSDELESESKVVPLTLLGMPLGYSLLSFLNFIPIGVVSTLVQFCGNELTADRCRADKWFS